MCFFLFSDKRKLEKQNHYHEFICDVKYEDFR